MFIFINIIQIVVLLLRSDLCSDPKSEYNTILDTRKGSHQLATPVFRSINKVKYSE